jgi:hypothetical protein
MSFSNKFWMGKCGKLELEQGKDILMWRSWWEVDH